ncbi:MAG: type II secretion system major pseudopilin GspG [Helicobacteraceae bacterium]|jgi:general secretion pathway protein G|nr:type II secretion system major pseudopilin GspG [Helicobacteraceae bacterium]
MSKGFTLMELMVVIVILGLLAALVVPNLMGQSEEAKQKLACVQMKQLQVALNDFKLNLGDYPTTEQGLEALIANPDEERFKNFRSGGYLSSKTPPKDPWNKPYIYINDDGAPDLISLGADGKEGGESQNRDLKLSECER